MLAAVARTWFPIVDSTQAQSERAADILEGRFLFNGEEHLLRPGFDWAANPSADIEWLILLHKFYYAVGLGRAWRETGRPCYVRKWMELTESWIDSVPLDFLPSDVAGRRIQNWISAWHYFSGAPEVDGEFRRKFLASLEAQAAWLRDHLTPSRNHRTLELLALFFAGVALSELPAAESWLAFSAQAIVENLEADLRPDGVHCEQSTDYHHIVLRNTLIVKRLAVLNDMTMPAQFDVLLRRALEFALHIHRPDGLIPSLSDGDTGSFLSLLEQGYEFFGDERYLWVATQGRRGRAPSQTMAAFPHGGYYIWRSGWGERERFEDERYLVFDCGPLGEGNHGHFDLLSFELYGFGQPLIVDPGRYTYSEAGDTNWRVLFRGTGYHNTVVVDGRNQTRYEPHKRKFKVKGPQPGYELVKFGPEALRGRCVSWEYDVVHERTIHFLDGRRFVIVDELWSESAHRYDLVFHLAPPADGKLTQRELAVETPHLRVDQKAPAALAVEDGWVSASYGSKKPAPIVTYSLAGTCARFETHLEVYP